MPAWAMGKVRSVRPQYATGVLLQCGDPMGVAKGHIPLTVETEWPPVNFRMEQRIHTDTAALAQAASDPEDVRGRACAEWMEETFQKHTELGVDIRTGNFRAWYKIIDILLR